MAPSITAGTIVPASASYRTPACGARPEGTRAATRSHAFDSLTSTQPRGRVSCGRQTPYRWTGATRRELSGRRCCTGNRAACSCVCAAGGSTNMSQRREFAPARPILRGLVIGRGDSERRWHATRSHESGIRVQHPQRARGGEMTRLVDFLSPPVIAKTGRKQVPERQRAVQILRALAEPYRLRVVPDAEGFALFPGRYGQIEWYCDGVTCCSCSRPGQSSNAESPQGEASHPARLDGDGAQVRGIASTRPKPQTTTGATAEYLTAGQIAELLQVSERVSIAGRLATPRSRCSRSAGPS